ncbi:MAG TPA: ABC transporter permease subunit [Solirubrobacteraceae bacterium]|nr:ABC transporter permease subunit [Solirubrobacteraceae bacterium]
MSATTTRAAARGAERALVRRRLLDVRVMTVACAYVFAIYSYVQPSGYSSIYKTTAERVAFAHSFGTSKGLRLLYGLPYDLATVDGYAAWRVGGVLAIFGAVYAMLAGVRLTRTEEESGRLELVLAAPVGRSNVGWATLAAIAAGTAVAWVAQLAGLAVGGVGLGGAAYLALATVSVIPVCAAVGVLASQIAPNRALALQLAGGTVAVLFVLRVLADVVGLTWLRWLTPLGWAELLRPFAGARPEVLLLPAAATGVLLALAWRITVARDIGTGLLRDRDRSAPHLAMLGSPLGLSLRRQRGVLIAWAGTLAAFSYLLGTIAKSISPADVSKSVNREIAKLGTGSITTPTGYVAFVFSFFALFICVFVCTQVAAARREEASQRLETMLAAPLGRRRWLAGWIVLALLAAAALALACGLLGWAGTSTAGVHLGLGRLLEAGANMLPVAVLFLGIATLAYAVAPRISGPFSYALLAVAYLWELVGALTGAPRWVLDVTPFAHIGLVPVEPFRTVGALLMIAIGAAAGAAALQLFRRRDLVGD